MPATTHCPDPLVLQQFALGQMPPNEVEDLAQHVEQCDHCTHALEALKSADTLVEAMAALTTVGDGAEAEAVQTLMKRLAGMRPWDAASESQSPPTTTADAAGPSAAAAAPVTGAGEDTTVPYDFLGPAERPGDLGRLGPYRVLKLLGTGGMGVVFLAEDMQLQRPVALKVMKPNLATGEAARRRFLREARTAAQIRHDHVVTIH
ncbi:MAG: hypothetical protein HYV60_01920, partial [Planctomycetia bacterium]|nr:hypothetical protein [Planctomycetia bacterium]